MQADALLVERLIDGSFGAANAELRKAAFDEVAKAYTEGLSNLAITPSQFESIVAQIELLARFFAARELAGHEPVLLRTARQLRNLVRLLQPARLQDGDAAAAGDGAGEEGQGVVVPVLVAGTPARAADKAPAAKKRAVKKAASRRKPH
jgi:hypothetical protein